MVSLVAKPATPFAIYLLQSIEVCVQLPSPLLGLVMEGIIGWLIFLGR